MELPRWWPRRRVQAKLNMLAAESQPPNDVALSELVVCLKWAPLRPEIDPLTGTVATDDRFSGLSAADQAALEWALRVGEQQGLAVSAVSIGGQEADAGLRQAMAAGASNAVRVDTGGQDLPSKAVAEALAHVCAAASLVFCGDHSADRGSGSVPAFLAASLGFGQALGCTVLELAANATAEQVVAIRRLDLGRRERLAVVGKTVLSFEGGLELRRAPLRATLAGGSAAIPVLNLGPGHEMSGQRSAVSTVHSGPFRPRSQVLPAPEGATIDRIRELTGVGQEQPTAQQLELSPDAAADVVVEQLNTWGYLGDDCVDAESDSDAAP